MYTHASNADPFVCGCVSQGFIAWSAMYKKELHYIPGIGVFMSLSGGWPIDRKNREKAIATQNAMLDGRIYICSRNNLDDVRPRNYKPRRART